MRRLLRIIRTRLGRFDAEAFRRRLHEHPRRWGLALLLLLLSAMWLHANFAIGVNASPSLPERLFLIHKGERPERGQYVAFRWHGGGPYAAGVTFVKRLAGVPGDVVTAVDGSFYVNGLPVGYAKARGRNGQALEQGATGVLPDGLYYVAAPHPDSLDSRYRLTGWIPASQFIGRAHALF